MVSDAEYTCLSSKLPQSSIQATWDIVATAFIPQSFASNISFFVPHQPFFLNLLIILLYSLCPSPLHLEKERSGGRWEPPENAPCSATYVPDPRAGGGSLPACQTRHPGVRRERCFCAPLVALPPSGLRK